MKPTLTLLTALLLSPLAMLPAVGGELHWAAVRDLPDPVGLKGMIAGVTGERIVIAGGSNFPVARSAGGKKTFHRAAWVRSVSAVGAGEWTPLGDVLPRAQGEGASVTTPHGIVSLGGDGGAGMLSEVFLLAWNNARGTLDLRPLPALPMAVGSAAAAWHEEKLYVAGGDDGRGGTRLWASLDLATALRDPSGARWEPLPAWPGQRRFGAVLVPLQFGQHTELVLAGGKVGTPGPATPQDYLADAFAFDITARTWRTLPPLLRPALLAVAFRIAPDRLMIAGGSDGHEIDRLAEIGDRYRMPGDVMLFDASAGRWSAAGAMPLGVAGAAVVPLPEGAHLIAGGEYCPALRTPRAFIVERPAK